MRTKVTDLSATERRRAWQRILFVRVPLLYATSAVGLFVAARQGLKLAGGLRAAEIESCLGFIVMCCVSVYYFRGPFRPPHRAALPPALVMCAVELHPTYSLLTEIPVPAVLRWPSTAALVVATFIPTRRWISRAFQRTLTEYARAPADESAAAVMLQECARMAADPNLSPQQRKVARLNQAHALAISPAPTPAALLEAVELLTELEADPLEERIQMFQTVVDLARIIGARASEYGDLTGYLEAFDLLARAAARMPLDEGAAVYVHAYTAEFEIAYAVQATNDQDASAHFRAAAHATQRAIDAVTPSVRHLLPELYANLAMCNATLAMGNAHLEDGRDEIAALDDAVGLCAEGIRAAARRPRRRAVVELVLCELLQQRAWAHVGRLAEDPPESAWAPIVADLREARRLAARVRRTGSPPQRREAAETLASVRSDMDQLSTTFPKRTVAAQWRRAAAMSEHDSTDTVVRVRTQWVNWAETTEDPQWCAEAYEKLLAVIPRAAASHYVSEERDRLLASVQNRTAEAGYWLSRNGQIRDAAVALERGRAVAVSELSSRDDSVFERVFLTGPHHELAVRLREATDQLARAERQAQEHPGGQDAQNSEFTTPVQRAWAEFDAVRREIGQTLGIELGSSVEYGDVADAAAEGPLVYLVCASRSGYAVIVRGAAEPDWVPLPKLSRERVEKHAYQPYQALDDKRAKYDEALLSEVLRWLWENGIAHLVDQLPRDAVVTLVPMGLLGLLPVHAAGGPMRDGQTPADWEHLIDHVAVRYSPSARMQARLPKRAWSAESTPLALLAFDAPTGNPDQPLDATQAELDSVCRHWPKPLQTRLDSAARDEVVAALNQHSVWHFAGHCEVTPERMQNSALLLEDARLTLDDLSTVPYAPRRLAVLSACHSHRSGEQLPDEVVGMPTALLLAGFAGVLATHWALGDGSAAFITARFYEEWREENCTPTEALRRAQRWVRQATRAELDAYLPGVLPRAWSSSAEAMAPSRAAERPYAQPSFWAPFALTGI